MKKRSAGTLTDLVLPYALMAIVVIAIVYGSLYPFAFRDFGSLGAGFLHLAGTWKQLPQSRGDTLANLLLYMPLGFTIMRSLGHRGSGSRAFAITVGFGAVLSSAIELAQFYDASRISTLSDVYLNVAGTLAGAAVARLSGAGWMKVSWPSGGSPAFARLLLLAWLGWRLYPYVPTIDLHKYWRSVQPLFVANVTAYGILHYALLWLSVAFLVQTGLGPKKPTRLLLSAMLCFFAAKIVVIGQTLVLPEILGAALAGLLAQSAFQRHARIGVPCLAVLLTLFVVLSRVLPWHAAAAHKAFQWTPFFGFLHGSVQTDVIVFAEKSYLYGVVLLLLVTTGMRLKTAIILECALLLSTSLVQIFMATRSAEITDALLALILGCVYALLLRQYSQKPGIAARR